VREVMVVEQNHGAQLLRYLRGMLDLPGKPRGFNRAGPLPLRPGEISEALLRWAGEATAGRKPSAKEAA
jgi:2-oxoglutarate ferredoxin oxidoreductase subunit alpha